MRAQSRPGSEARAAFGAAGGALIIATSAFLVAQSGATVATAAAARCLYAVPILVLLGWGRLPRGWLRSGMVGWAALAGVFFAVDLLLWHTSIAAIGTGLATVLANCQVVIVGLVAWIVLGERPTRGQALAVPVVVFGIVAISGALGGGVYGDRPVLGAVTGAATGVAYSGFLLSLRAATPEGGSPVWPLAIASLVSGLGALAAGLIAPGLVGAIESPGPAGHAWLLILAVSCQVVAWILIAVSLSQLPALAVSLILPLQPIGSLLLGAVLLAERPSALQWAGAALVLVGMVVAAMSRPSATARDAAQLPARRLAQKP